MSAPAPAAAESPRRRRWRRLLCIWLPGLFAAWILFGFFGVPLLVRKAVVPRIGQRLNGAITLGDCSFNPFTWRLILRDAQITDGAGARVLAAGVIDANIEPWSCLFRSGWRLQWVRIDSPYVRAELERDGRLNLAGLVKPPSEPSPPLERIPRIVIGDLAVRSGSLHIADLMPEKPVRLDWEGLTFSLAGVDTQPDHDNVYRLEASNDAGERLSWTGRLLFNPLTSDGLITVEGLGLARFDPYVDRFTHARLTGGRLNAAIGYDFDPVGGRSRLTGRATVRGLSLDRAEGRWIDLPSIEVKDLHVLAFERQATIGAIEVSGGTISTDRDAQGRWFFERLVKARPTTQSPTPGPRPAPAADTPPDAVPFPLVRLERAVTRLLETAAGDWAVALDKLAVRQLDFGFDDRSPRTPVRIDLKSLTLDAGPIRSTEQFRTPLHLHAALGPGSLDLNGELRPAEPATQLRVELRDADLAIVAPYIPAQLTSQLPPADLRRGRATLSGDLQATFASGVISSRWTGDSTINALELTPSGGAKPLLTIDRITHNGVLTAAGSASGQADVTHQGKASVDGLRLDAPFAGGISLSADRLSADGRAAARVINGVAELTADGSAQATNLAAQSRSTLGGASASIAAGSTRGEARVTVDRRSQLAAKGELNLTTLHAEAAAPPGPLTVDSAAVKLEGESNLTLDEATHQLRAAGRATLDGAALAASDLVGPIRSSAGRLSLEGVATAAPGSIVLEGAVSGSTLTLAGPELAGPVDASFETISLSGRASHAGDHLMLSGDAELAALRARLEKVLSSEVQWRSLQLRRASLDTQTRAASIESVRIVSPSAQSNVAVTPRPADQPQVPVFALSDLRHLRPLLEHLSTYSLAIGSAQVDGGVLRLNDPLSDPPTSLLVEDLRLKLDGFATATTSPMRFEASARVQNSGRLTASGSIDLRGDQSTADARADLAVMPVPPYSALAGRYVGYQVDAGRLTSSLPVKVQNNTLSGVLDFSFDGLTLGRETNSPDAPSIPIKLGLALLRDANDRIEGKLPFEGKLDDPEFSMGGLIWQAILGLLTKAATAPFTLLASLFGGGDADLSIVSFSPGSADLSPEMLGQLDKLGSALTQRPALNVRVFGGVDPEADQLALRTLAWKQQALRSVRGDAPDAKPLTPDEYRDAVADAYDQLKLTAPAKPTLQQMESALVAAVALPPDALESLAARRAQAVARELIVQRSIPEARVQLAKPGDQPAAPAAPKSDTPAPPTTTAPAVRLELF